MASTSTLKRVSKTEQQTPQVESGLAKKIALSWMQLVQCEDALCAMEAGVFAWRVAPPIQLAMASCVVDLLKPTDKITTLGFQAYPWVRAACTPTSEILSIQLGKSLPQNIYADTAEGIAANFKAGEFAIVALHADCAADWQDVRAITTAAVKKEVPMLMVISAAVNAPKGVIVETIENWAQAVNELRAAIQSVREQKAIRVIAVADMDSASLEMAMMEAAELTPQMWGTALQKNADGAEVAVQSAYLAPVRSF